MKNESRGHAPHPEVVEKLATGIMGGASITETHISTITDSIILLRYVEVYGEMRRGLTVLKMRGSTHDKEIREFTIDDHGLHIGKSFRTISGILSGNLFHMAPGESERIKSLFKDEEAIWQSEV